jgi:hypothetical protein
MPDRQGIGAGGLRGFGCVTISGKQAQGSVLHQKFGVGSGAVGQPRELRFLLGREMDFHVSSLRNNELMGKGSGQV